MRFAFGAGGTGGHIFPAISIALALENSLTGTQAEHLNSRAKRHDYWFIGNAKSLEQRLAREHGFPFRPVYVAKLYRKLCFSNLYLPFVLVGSTISCICMFLRKRFDAVICTGSYVSGPVALAAIMTHTPLYFHESNAYPGLTTRLLARFTVRVFTAWNRSTIRIPHSCLVGVPLMPITNPPEIDMTKLGLDPDKPKLLVLGGSQGSLRINECISECVDDILSMGFEIIWQAGSLTLDQFKTKHSTTPGVYLFSFSSSIHSFYHKAEIAITRAGAMTIAELVYHKIPAVLIPLPTSAENHQYYNAKSQRDNGMALLVQQNELNKSSLLAAIKTLKEKHCAFKNSLEHQEPNTASAKIANIILTDLGAKDQNPPQSINPINPNRGITC